MTTTELLARYETAQHTIGMMIATRSEWIAIERKKDKPDRTKIDKWLEDQGRFTAEQHELLMTDEANIDRVIAEYGPIVRAQYGFDTPGQAPTKTRGELGAAFQQAGAIMALDGLSKPNGFDHWEEAVLAGRMTFDEAVKAIVEQAKVGYPPDRRADGQRYLVCDHWGHIFVAGEEATRWVLDRLSGQLASAQAQNGARWVDLSAAARADLLESLQDNDVEANLEAFAVTSTDALPDWAGGGDAQRERPRG